MAGSVQACSLVFKLGLFNGTVTRITPATAHVQTLWVIAVKQIIN